MRENSPRLSLMTPRKSKSRLVLRLTHEDAEALAAALTTEADFSITDDSLEVIEIAGSLVDLRARWNTLMRGLIASELVLGVAGDDK